MKNAILKIGMPAGSLANPGRGGNLIQLLETSGFKTKGYDTGGPSKFTTTNLIYGWDGRPQEFSSQLGINELDVAIAGDDWIKERIIELKMEYDTEIELEKVLSLNRGGVRLVGIIDTDNDFTNTEDYIKNLIRKKSIITVVSEMPYLALNWIREKLQKINRLEDFKEFSVQKYKTPSKIKKGVLIYETWGKTEAKIKNKGADIGLEITQSGSSIRNYDLRIIEEVMQSETSIWINPAIKKDEQKNELLNMFLLNLYGAVNAENKMMVIFNVPNSKSIGIEKYLKDKKLFADEPTKTPGKDFTVYNIQVDGSNNDEPVAKIRYELAKLGATNIDTLPLSSSIQGIDILGK